MHRHVTAFAAAVALVVGVAGVLVPAAPVSAAPLDRSSDPVVLTGADIPPLVNTPKGTLVGFRWTGSAWAQLPIQIDERAVVNFGKIYNNPSALFYNSQPGLVNELVYTSAATWTGNDPNAKFDENDELAFMARDAGLVAPGGSQPTGTIPGTGVQLHVTDPKDESAEGYVYLFRKASGSGLQQGARVKYVKYTFRLASGAYKTTYNTTAGPNPENSWLVGGTYKRHFSDRWLNDVTQVITPGSTGLDLLDRQKVLFAPGVCGRSEDTFDAAEGAFVVNKTGPVRAIRSYLGANSGPSTQRTHIFYDRREDTITDLRVHAIPSVMDFMDYSANAIGSTYRNSLNPTGVTIDGQADTLTGGLAQWEQVTGPAGTITHVPLLQSSATLTTTGWYRDALVPSPAECTPDTQAIGQSGAYITSAIPSTDPAQGGTDTMRSVRFTYYDAPGGTAADAADHAADALAPLTATANTWLP